MQKQPKPAISRQSGTCNTANRPSLKLWTAGQKKVFWAKIVTRRAQLRRGVNAQAFSFVLFLLKTYQVPLI